MLTERVPGLLPDLGLEDALKWLRCIRSLGCRSCFSEAAAAASQTVSVAVIGMKGHGRYDPARAANYPAPWSPDGATVGERGQHRRATLALNYTLYSTLLTAKQFSFGIFSIALPVIRYVIFTQTYGYAGGPTGSTGYGRHICVPLMSEVGDAGPAWQGGRDQEGSQAGAERHANSVQWPA
jgi:hypothetical protein